jgi:chromosome segregation ATPase
MRHAVFLLLGFLEVTVALILILVGQMMTSADMPEAFTKAEAVARRSSNQVNLVRQQLEQLRRPELQSLAQRLQEQTRAVTSTLQSQDVDFETIRTLHDVLGEAAAGFESLADSIQPNQVGDLGDGLGEAAAFLERIVPASSKAAEELEKAADALRADTVKHQEKAATLPKDIRVKTARPAEELPALSKDVAQLLRGTEKLKEVAQTLRQAQKSAQAARERWPEPQKALVRSAALLRATRKQLKTILDNPQQYEAARQQGVRVGETLAVMVPLLTEQLNGQLTDQDEGLSELGQSIDEVGDLLPAYGHTLSRLLQIGRLLAWLVAAVTCLHGVYLMLSARMGRRYSV